MRKLTGSLNSDADMECLGTDHLLEGVGWCKWGGGHTVLCTQKCTNPRPLINDRSLNTPHQRHYSSYLLISTFWGGVVKDREAPFSSPNYVLLKNVWGLMSLLVAFYLQKMWNANWIHGPNCHVSFIWMQSLSNVFLVRMIKTQFHSSS